MIQERGQKKLAQDISALKNEILSIEQFKTQNGQSLAGKKGIKHVKENELATLMRSEKQVSIGSYPWSTGPQYEEYEVGRWTKHVLGIRIDKGPRMATRHRGGYGTHSFVHAGDIPIVRATCGGVEIPATCISGGTRISYPHSYSLGSGTNVTLDVFARECDCPEGRAKISALQSEIAQLAREVTGLECIAQDGDHKLAEKRSVLNALEKEHMAVTRELEIAKSNQRAFLKVKEGYQEQIGVLEKAQREDITASEVQRALLIECLDNHKINVDILKVLGLDPTGSFAASTSIFTKENSASAMYVSSFLAATTQSSVSASDGLTKK